MSSTLVETVSLNYEDFNDSFLTCGTCLCVYDSQAHIPKILHCSHTVCKSCLEHIIEAQGRDTTSFRCPICRETITIPRGGVGSLPPSFIVNQLLDLMTRQRRDVVPKCSNHSSQELLFCETCDTVFCTLCSGCVHSGRGASAHTVIPFSIAIKRMSEILLYKASLCMKNLTGAGEVVSKEIQSLDVNAEKCLDSVSVTFQDMINLLERRRLDVIDMVKKVRDEKKQVLDEQLSIIDGEKAKVQVDCQGLQHQIEVRNITKKISDLNEKLDVSTTLAEPRENAFMKFEYEHNSALDDLVTALSEFGRIKISKTFPALCTARVDKVISHLKSSLVITTVDYHGNPRTSGADPVHAELKTESGTKLPLHIKDHDNGTYTITFTAHTTSTHRLYVSIFDRPIRDSPFTLNVTDHTSPSLIVGRQGHEALGFNQPVQVVVDPTDDCLYVLDTGNSRIQVINSQGQFLRQIKGPGLEDKGCTGMAMSPSRTLVIVNWRTKQITTLSQQGELLHKFTSDDLKEPTNLAVNRHGEIIVADNGAGCAFVFNSSGEFIRRVGTKGSRAGQVQLISNLCTSPSNDDIILLDHRIQVFSRSGKFIRELPKAAAGVSVGTGASTPCRGHYGGIAFDRDGNFLLVTRSEKSLSCVQVYKVDSHHPHHTGGDESTQVSWLFNIDSHESKLKRPNGLSTMSEDRVAVVDLGNDSVKIFKYK